MLRESQTPQDVPQALQEKLSNPAAGETEMEHFHDAPDLPDEEEEMIERSVSWLSARFNLGAGQRVLNLGCGPGLYAARLARSGAHVMGVDFSARSLQYAREVSEQQGLGIGYVECDYLDYHAKGTYDLIVLVMCECCVPSASQRAGLLDNCLEMLEPGGAFVFDATSLRADNIEAEVSSAGFEIEERLGNMAGAPYDAAVGRLSLLVRKPA